MECTVDWTDEQISELLQLRFAGAGYAEMAAILQVPVGDVYAKLYHLGRLISSEDVASAPSCTDPWPWGPIVAAFNRLDGILNNTAAAMDETNAANLQRTAAGISVLKSLLLNNVVK